ncbi:MAG: NAD(P)H-dependent oxidoreductase [Solirubrobacteraceae bacterium]|nr:NAD(P)H-dependent oxidoreductase [Solirubrobacteraceae bacterium]
MSAEATNVVVLSAGVSDPSSTRLLADRAASKVVDELRAQRREPSVGVIELAPLAVDVAAALVGGVRSAELDATIERLAAADVLIVSTPVYKAGPSGLLKAFVDLLDNDLLVGTTVILAATAGTARHALVVDAQLRELFAFLRAVAVPTALFAAPEDWSDPALTARIERAAAEAAILAGSRQAIRERTWAGHRHEFGSGAAAPGGAGDVDFDTDLMRLATGGSAPPRRRR